MKECIRRKYSKDTLGSSDDAIKLQHEVAIISEQKDKEAKMMAKKPINSSKEKMAKTEHGSKTVDIPNSPSKPSERDSVVPSEPQKIPANPKMKLLCQNKTKKRKRPIAHLLETVMEKNYMKKRSILMTAQKKGFTNSLPCLRIVTVVMTSSLRKSDGHERRKVIAILQL